jgi:pimeloyl-ACP methyl ester carboxylesterase
MTRASEELAARDSSHRYGGIDRVVAQTYGERRTPAPADAAELRRFSILRPGGVRLFGEHRGDPSAPSVLLLHATGRNRHMWSDLARLLGHNDLHVVTADLHGHGDSDWSAEGDYSIDSFVADVLAVCEQRGPFNAILGTSLGAVAAVLATARASTPLTRSVVLVDVEPTVESLDMHRIRTALNRAPQGFESPGQVYAALAQVGFGHVIPSTDDGLRVDDRGRYYWKCDPRTLDIGQRPLGRARNALIAQALAAASVPVLVVRGALPRRASVSGARRLASLPVDAELVDLEAWQGSRGEAGQAFSSVVTAFVRRRTTGLLSRAAVVGTPADMPGERDRLQQGWLAAG